MTNTITMDQLKELLKIQKDFDNRMPKLNLQNSKIAYVVEFFEWFNTLETFKNWKKKPGKALDVQLDELADILAFGLSIDNQQGEDEDLLNAIIKAIEEDGKSYPDFDLSKPDVMKSVVTNVPLVALENSDVSKVFTLALPFGLAAQFYTIDQLITAYKSKMEVNHARQDGTTDKDKGYV